MFEIASSHNVLIDKHTVAFAAKCGLKEYMMEIANSENVDKETIRQHDDIMNRHQMLSGGETALFFAAEQKDFKFSGLLLLFILKQTNSFHLFMLSMTSNLE